MKAEMEDGVQITLVITPAEATEICNNDWDKTHEPSRPGKVLYGALARVAHLEDRL